MEKLGKGSGAADWFAAELADTIDEDYELGAFRAGDFDGNPQDLPEGTPPSIARADYFRALLALQAELIKLQDWVSYHKERSLRSLRAATLPQRRRDQAYYPRMNHGPVVLSRYLRRPNVRRPNGISSAMCRICRPAVRSCCSTAPGTTVLVSSASWFRHRGPGRAVLQRRSGVRAHAGPFRPTTYQVLVLDHRRGQQLRFLMRIHDPLKQWKLSPMDLQSRVRWEAYTKAKEATFARTNIPEAPWYIVEGNDKKRARLNYIDHLLTQVPYEDVRTKRSLCPIECSIRTMNARCCRRTLRAVKILIGSLSLPILDDLKRTEGKDGGIKAAASDRGVRSNRSSASARTGHRLGNKARRLQKSPGVSRELFTTNAVATATFRLLRSPCGLERCDLHRPGASVAPRMKPTMPCWISSAIAST